MRLVGREVPLAACEAAWRDAVDGRGRVVLVAGEAGIGKTALARAVADRAAASGAVVRWGASWEGGNVPLAPWIDALRRPGGDAGAAAAARLADGSALDTDDPAATDQLRLHLFAGVVDALLEAGAEAPQLVVLDDLHWADTTSILLLRAVAAHSPTMPLLVLGTYRDEEVVPDSPLLGMGGSAEHLGLEGLPEPAVGELLAEVLGRRVTPDERRVVCRRTAGNPLLVTHVGRLLAAGAPMGVPAGVRDVLGRRLARLPAACHEVLGAAAVLGPEFDAAAVGELLELAPTDVLRALDTAAAARLVAPVSGGPDRWNFTHALVQAARYDDLGSPERAALHRRACEVLVRRPGTPAGVLAHHAARASFPPDDPRPAELAVAAADEARGRLALEEAIPLYERALERAPATAEAHGLRVRAWLGLGDVRLRTGDAAATASCFETCADLARSIGDAELLARAALGFGAGLGSFEVRMLDARQISLLEEAADRLDGDSPLRPLVLARLSVALSFVGSEDARRALADEALAGARAAGDAVAVGAALAARCDALAGPQFAAERLEMAGEIVALALRRRDRRLELLGRRHRVAALAEVCDIEGLDAEIGAFSRTADVLDDPLYSWYVPLWRAMRGLAAGRLDEARRLLAEARSTGARAGSANARVLTVVVELFITLEAGAVDAARSRMTALLEEVPDAFLLNGPPMVAYVDLLAEAPGAAERARAVVAGLDRLPVDAEWLATLAPLTDIVHRLGLVGDAARVYERFSPFTGYGVVEGIAAAHRGPTDRWLLVLAAMLGDEAAALRHLDRALDLGRRIGELVLADVEQAAAEGLRLLDADRFAGRADALEASAADALHRLRLDTRVDAAPSHPPAPASIASRPALVREGDTWAVTWDGSTVRIRHAKGVADLAVLLAHPGRDVHVRELEGVPDLPATSPQAALDHSAVAAYRRRLEDLEEDFDEAERDGDLGRAARLAVERDALVEELTRAFGLGGRRRRAGSDPDERLRKAVSARVRTSIERLEALHPALGRHLRNSVRTGLWCTYRPERSTTWEVAAGGR